MPVNLNQITAIGGDGSRTGEVSPVIDNSHPLALAFRAAEGKAQNDWNRYTTFQGNLKDFYKNVANIDTSNIMQVDRENIMGSYHDFLQFAQDNVDVIMNPMKNQQAYGELMNKEEMLQKNIQQSKGHQAYLDLHDKLLQTTPGLNNKTNRAKLDKFASSSIDERTPFTLEAPTIFKPDEVAAKAADFAKQQFAMAKLSDDKKYWTEEEGTKYLQDKYLEGVRAFKGMQDGSGNIISDVAENAYNALPEGQKNLYKNPDDYYEQTMLKLAPIDQIKSKKVSEDKYAMEDQNFGHEIQKLQNQHNFAWRMQELEGKQALDQIAARNKNDKDLYEWKYNFDLKKKEDKADFLNDEVAKLWTSPATYTKKVNGKDVTVPDTRKVGDNVEQEMQMSNVLKESLGVVVGTDEKTQKPIIRYPDALTKTSDGQLRALFFKRVKDDDGKESIERGDKGGVVDFQLTRTMSPDQLKLTLAGNLVKKDELDDVLTLSNNKLKKMPGIESPSLDNGNLQKYAEAMKIGSGSTTTTPAARSKGKLY